jgi:hypothetical protein
MMKTAALAALLVGCGASSGPDVNVYIPPGDTQVPTACPLTTLAGGSAGDCYARWVCVVEGVRTLVCGGLDAGVGCACLQDNQPPTYLVDVPSDCGSAASDAVTAFAREKCGWADL